MAKSRTSLGRTRGPELAWKLDDRAGVLQGDNLGFTAKANGQRPTIVRVLPEVELIDGQPVIQPMRIIDDDGEATTSYFFEKVTVVELGSGQNFTSFIADPSDAEDGMSRSDFPVMKLRSVLEDAIEARAEWVQPYMTWFMPHGKYDSIDFPWPVQYTVLQVFAYLQPGCNHKDTIEKHGQRLMAHPQYGHVLAQPEKKFMFIKGSGADALDDMFLGRDPDTEQFKVPDTVLGPESGAGLFISGEKEIDEKERTERSVCTVTPFDLGGAGFYVPNEADLVKFWTPWDKVFRKMTYDEQVKKLAQIFGNDLIRRVFDSGSAAGQDAGPIQTSAPGPGQESQTGGWQQPAPAAAPQQQAPQQQPPQGGAMVQQPAQAQVAQNQQPPTQAQQPAAPAGGGWNIPAQPTQQAQQPAAGQPQGGPQGAISDATAQTPETPAGPMSSEDVRSRFEKYSQGGPK